MVEESSKTGQEQKPEVDITKAEQEVVQEKNEMQALKDELQKYKEAEEKRLQEQKEQEQKSLIDQKLEEMAKVYDEKLEKLEAVRMTPTNGTPENESFDKQEFFKKMDSDPEYRDKMSTEFLKTGKNMEDLF